MLLPALLAAEAGGRKRFELESDTVGDALRALPIADLLFDERGQLRPLVRVYVGREPGALETELRGEDTVRIVAAIAGG